MSAAAVQPYENPARRPARGASLLLAHCAGVTGPGGEREAPYGRLEAAVGGDLAHLLVYALSGAHGRGGVSSP